MTDTPRSYVTSVDGQLVLVDPDAYAMAQAIAKRNCVGTFEGQKERVAHFVRRAKELGKSPSDVLITLINVDDPQGRPLADALMPNHDWDSIRATGATPYARGLAMRGGLQSVIDETDKEAGQKLRATPGFAVMVVDFGTIEIFAAE
jgi:spore cortex formation protein SpoVR/YcgB (stage V sporulation)